MRLVLEYDSGSDCESCYSSMAFWYESKEKFLTDLVPLAEEYIVNRAAQQAEYTEMHKKYPTHLYLSETTTLEWKIARRNAMSEIYEKYKNSQDQFLGEGTCTVPVSLFIRDGKLKLPTVLTVEQWFGESSCA